MKIGMYEFKGPFTIDELENLSGVYAILCDKIKNYDLIDVGESATIKDRINDHSRTECWIQYCTNYKIAVHYTPNLQQHGRTEIEQNIRDKFPDIPCGDR